MESNSPSPIVLTEIYDITLDFSSEEESQKWIARLLEAGFRLSICAEAYFHPTHWENASMAFTGPGGEIDPGDLWLMNDAFKCKTDEAREHMKRMEEE